MEYGKDLFVDTDLLDEIAKFSGKTVMLVKAEGVKNCDDEKKIEEVWDFYFGKCDLNVLNLLKQFGEVYCYFDTVEQGLNAMEEWFPRKSQLLPGEEHLFMDTYLISPDGNTCATTNDREQIE